MSSKKVNIKIIKEISISSIKRRMEALIAESKNVKFLIITDLKLLSQFQELKKFKIIDIISINEEDCDKKAAYVLSQFNLLDANKNELLIVIQENDYERRISEFHLLLMSLGMLYIIYSLI